MDSPSLCKLTCLVLLVTTAILGVSVIYMSWSTVLIQQRSNSIPNLPSNQVCPDLCQDLLLCSLFSVQCVCRWCNFNDDDSRPNHKAVCTGDERERFIRKHLRFHCDPDDDGSRIHRLGSKADAHRNETKKEGKYISGSRFRSNKIHVFISTTVPDEFIDAIVYFEGLLQQFWKTYHPVKILIRMKSIDRNGRVLADTDSHNTVHIAHNSLVPMAIAKRIRRNFPYSTSVELNMKEYDFSISINRHVTWYNGTDGKPGKRQDLVTTLLHEAIHGFIQDTVFTFRVVSNPQSPEALVYSNGGAWGLWYKHLVYKTNDRRVPYCPMQSLANEPELLYQAATSGNVFFATSDNWRLIEVYAPPVFRHESSLVHFKPWQVLDTPNRLFVPASNRGHAYHKFTPLLKIIFHILSSSNIRPPKICENTTVDLTPYASTWGSRIRRLLLAQTF